MRNRRPPHIVGSEINPRHIYNFVNCRYRGPRNISSDKFDGKKKDEIKNLNYIISVGHDLILLIIIFNYV